MSIYFDFGFDMMCNCLLAPIHVSTVVGESLVVDQLYLSYLVSLLGMISG